VLPSPADPRTGGCLCGGVRFELTAPFRRTNLCHCSRCRRHSGGPGLAQGRVPREAFRLLAGAELLRVFRPPGGMAKVFCSVCGSSVFGGTWPDGPEVSVRLGAIDGDGHPPSELDYHSHVDWRAPWDTLPDDGLPRYAVGPPLRPRT
jgi:hypothetical protein